MPYELTWGGDPEDIYVVFSGRGTLGDLGAWVDEALADPRFRPGLRILIDHRNADWTGLTSDALRLRADQLERFADRIGPQHIAWIPSKKVDYGIGRMLEALFDERTQLTTRPFESIDAARAWLREAGA